MEKKRKKEYTENIPNIEDMTIKPNMENCISLSVFPDVTPLGMSYVPFQQWETPYDQNLALSRGTIFPGLDLPFIGEEAIPNDRKR